MLVQEGEVQRFDGLHGESEIKDFSFPLLPKTDVSPVVSLTQSECFSIDALANFRKAILNEPLFETGQGVAMKGRHLDVIENESIRELDACPFQKRNRIFRSGVFQNVIPDIRIIGCARA